MTTREPSVAQQADDRKRIAEYLRGDPAVFGEIDGWIRAEILSSYGSLREDHEDLCQVVHEKLLTNLRGDQFACRSTLRSYISGITSYTAIDRLRRRYRDRVLVQDDEDREPQDTSRNPYQVLASEEERHLLHRAIQLSSPACRKLWEMVFLDRLPYVEIGERLSIPPGTVKSRAWHCRKKALSILSRLRRATGPRSPSRGRSASAFRRKAPGSGPSDDRTDRDRKV